MNDAIAEKLRRFNAAIGQSEVVGLDAIHTVARTGPNFRYVQQDFRGDVDDDNLKNQAFSLIASICSLTYCLKAWARSQNVDIQRIDNAVDRSLALKLLFDLWDRDKHGGERRDGSRSKKSPRLIDLNRVGKIGSAGTGWSGLSTSLDGKSTLFGQTSVKSVFDGKVVDSVGNLIMPFDRLIETAIEDLETLLVDLRLITICRS